MQPNTVRAVVVIALLVAALSAVLVDALWLRAVLVIVPALFIAQRALMAPLPKPARRPEVATPPAADGRREAVTEPTRSPYEDRRQDQTIRRHIQQLLDLIRDFYSTCRMVAVGQLSAAKAKEKAQEVEEKVNDLMNDILQRIDDVDEGEGGPR